MSNKLLTRTAMSAAIKESLARVAPDSDSLTDEELLAITQSDLSDMTWMSDEDKAELLRLLAVFFDRWEELHRIIPTGDRSKMEAASFALVEQANAVRAFYG
jgi:class 3 adenylate cyclase